MSGVGQTSTAQGAQMGQATAANVGQFGAQSAAAQGSAAMSAGDARASGYISQGNIASNLINDLSFGAGQYFGGTSQAPAGGVRGFTNSSGSRPGPTPIGLR